MGTFDELMAMLMFAFAGFMSGFTLLLFLIYWKNRDGDDL